MMLPQGWNRAIPAYDRALQLRPGFREAAENRAVAEAFLAQQKAAEAERAANQTDDPGAKPPDPDQIVADQPPGLPHPDGDTPAATPQGLSDEEIQSLWMRRVGGTPAEFLRQQFARQAESERR